MTLPRNIEPENCAKFISYDFENDLFQLLQSTRRGVEEAYEDILSDYAPGEITL